MFFSRFTALFLLSATAFVSAHPTDVGAGAVAKRGDVDIHTVCYALKTATEEILPKIDAIVKEDLILSVVKVTPLVKDLTTALETAAASLAVLAIEDTTKKEEIAAILAEIVEKITECLDAVLKKGGILLVAELVAGFAAVDAALDKVLCGADKVLAGVLELVGGLIGGVVDLLKELVFKLTLGSCGY